MKRIPAAIFLSGMLLLAGCSNKTKEQSSAVVTDTTEAMTEFTSDKPAPPEITTAATLAAEAETTGTETTTTAAVTEGTAEGDPVSTAAPLITTLAPVTTQMMGGQGGQENGENPHPLHFNYFFSPEYVGLRLAGGNYQSISGDFAEAVEHNADMTYTLDDINFDGTPDLFVAIHGFDTPNVQYAVYLWNPDQKKFAETPLLYLNPVCHADTKEFYTLEQKKNDTDGEETLCVMDVYTWAPSLSEIKPKKAREYVADFKALTLTETSTDGSDPKETSFESKEALEKAVLDLYSVS